MAYLDSYAHVFSRCSAEFPRLSPEWLPPDREEPVEDLLVEMEAHDTNQAVLVQVGGAAVEHHNYLLHCLRTYPDNFRGIGHIPANCPEPECHMDRLADDTGIIGFQLFTLSGPRDPFDPVDVRTFGSYPIWRHAADSDYVLYLHVPAAEAHLPRHLLDCFPQVRVVLNYMGVCPGKNKVAHNEWGRPQIEESGYSPAYHTTHRLTRYENVMVHFAGQYAFSKEDFPYRDLTPWYRNLLHEFGPRRFLWATDYPWIRQQPGYLSSTRIVRDLLPDLPECDFESIMGEKARSFLRFPPQEVHRRIGIDQARDLMENENGKKQNSLDHDAKIQAVQRVLNGKQNLIDEVADDLGISRFLMWNWTKEYYDEARRTFPTHKLWEKKNA